MAGADQFSVSAYGGSCYFPFQDIARDGQVHPVKFYGQSGQIAVFYFQIHFFRRVGKGDFYHQPGSEHFCSLFFQIIGRG